MTTPSILKRAYDGVALFAVLHLALLGGLIVAVFASGALDREKAVRLVAVLRGEWPIPDEDSAGQDALSSAETSADEPAETTTVTSQTDLDIMHREAERIRVELEQQLALVHSMMLRVTTAREAFAKETQEQADRDEVTSNANEQEGYKKQIEIYEALSPKVAVEHLLSMADPAEAAGILVEMETRKAKKIVESAKRGKQLAQMKAILRRVREVSPGRSAELSSQGG